MHRPRRFTGPHSARRLPPFGAVGWIVTILSGESRRRDNRPEPDDRPAALLGDMGLTEIGIGVARPRKLAGHIASWLMATIRNRCGNR